jgi:hypothetical protein
MKLLKRHWLSSVQYICIRHWTKLRGLSPRANYTDRVTAACRRSKCQLLRLAGVAWSAQRIPMAVFSALSRYYFFQVAPQLYSRGWVDAVPDPLVLRISGSAGNRAQDLWICSQGLWPLDHRCGPASVTPPDISVSSIYIKCNQYSKK